MRNEHSDCGLETRHFYARPDVQLRTFLMGIIPLAVLALAVYLGGKAPSCYWAYVFCVSYLGLLVWQIKRRSPLISIGEKAISFWDPPMFRFGADSDYSNSRSCFLWSELDQRHGLENGVLVLYSHAKITVPIDKLEANDQKAVLDLVETYLAAKAEWVDCLACGEPIDPSLHRCPKCGWTWD